ncbi:hypothetical protein M3Y95_00347500 [Aphelenchoides besseyi]|nr:hypothetical protein M3Y95_00347500 [Aphelenchoides besseyi]
MSAKVLLVLLGLLSYGNSKSIDWSFRSGDDQILLLNMTIGTPGQFVSVGIVEGGAYNDVAVSDLRSGGVFNPSASTSFVQTGTDYDFDNKTVIGIFGTDTFQFGNSSSMKKKSFKVYNNQSWFPTTPGHIGFGRTSKDSQSFVDSIISELDERVVVFAYDHVGDSANSSGTITFGSRHSDRCADDWILVSEHISELFFGEWMVEIDTLVVGKYEYDSPGQMGVSLASRPLLVPETYYLVILNNLNAGLLHDVDCDILTDIVFTIDQLQIHISPEDYLDKSQQNETGTCYVQIDKIDDYETFYLPNSILKRYCLMYDYAQFNVEFATRLSN